MNDPSFSGVQRVSEVGRRLFQNSKQVTPMKIGKARYKE